MRLNDASSTSHGPISLKKTEDGRLREHGFALSWLP